MTSRRTFTKGVSSIPLLYLTGCGGGGSNGASDSSSTVPGATPTTTGSSEAVFSVMDLPINHERVMVGHVDAKTTTSFACVKNTAGQYEPAYATLDSEGRAGDVTFAKDGRINQVIAQDNTTTTFEYLANATVARTTNPSGAFTRGFAAFSDPAGRIFVGKLLTSAFVGPESLTEVSDQTDLVNQYTNAATANVKVSVSKLLERLLGLVIPSAMAQTEDDQFLKDLKDRISNGLLKNKGVTGILLFAVGAVVAKALLDLAKGIAVVLGGLISALATLGLSEILFIGLIIFLAFTFLSSIAKASGSEPINITGTFSGGDSGPFNAFISPSLQISGTAYSNDDKATFSVSGVVDTDGSLNFSTTGNATTGATFVGRIVRTRIFGTWKNPNFDIGGIFYGYLQPKSAVPRIGFGATSV